MLPSVSPTFSPFLLTLTDTIQLDMPVEDLRTIMSRLSKQPSYVTQEVRVFSVVVDRRLI